ncbi:hypothetical protein HYT53_04115 [Candidatus Woesearchaeota archaeon]|nr:hypothetical protein [Candidatus Woesearchaeota archaeon]
MAKKTSYEIKKDIILVLREKRASYTKIQTKLSTNYDSVKNNIKELEDYGFVKVEKKEHHAKNGKYYFEAELTQKGHELARKYKDKASQK